MAIAEYIPLDTVPSARQRDQASVVKSASRALQILEFFDHIQREACVSEISRALCYPQSSTSALLRSLVSMGYLLHDRFNRTYLPTRRVSLLGNWVDPALLQQGELLVVAEDLARATGLNVVMATANGLSAQYIYSHRPPASRPDDMGAPVVGTLAPIAHTAVGRALLATYEEAHVAKLLRRINAERCEIEPATHVQDFLAALKVDRRRSVFGGGAGENRSGLAATLDRRHQPLVIAIEGPQEELRSREAELAAQLGTAVARHGRTRTMRTACSMDAGLPPKTVADLSRLHAEQFTMGR